MRFTTLSILNFGVFCGENIFDFTAETGPIILVGGNNGSGKTTILESIRLCLYGKNAEIKFQNDRDFNDYITKKINKNVAGPIKIGAIKISFEIAQFGKKHNYQISRSWKVLEKEVNEELQVTKDFQPLKEIAIDYYQDYIQDLIPVGISSLFFFDGEKIQTIANDGKNDELKAEEIKKLLGIGHIERLMVDLAHYITRKTKEGVNTEPAKLLEALNAKQEEYSVILNLEDQLKINKLNEIAHLKNSIIDIETKISIESGGYAKERNNIKEMHQIAIAQIENQKKKIHELCAGLFPFSILPQELLALKQQLDKEASITQWVAAKKILEPRIEKLSTSFNDKAFWNGHDFSKHQIDIRQEKISLIINSFLEPPPDLHESLLRHNYSDSENLRLQNWINTTLFDLPLAFAQAIKELEELEGKRNDLQGKLELIPDDEFIKPLMELLVLRNRELWEMLHELETMEAKIQDVINRKEKVLLEIKKNYEVLKVSEQNVEKIKTAKKTLVVLKEFYRHIIDAKITQLEGLFLQRFREIIRKNNMIKSIKISSEDFSIRLFDHSGNSFSKDDFSAGEKQIFAISFLWALRQISGRPFPVIIDTPLGRLDSEHRDKLIENYFPHTSHQVIILSTDTEITSDYYRSLQEYISHAYRLKFNEQTGNTDVQNGYFWDN